jgi:small subunit ribosomal protein S6
LRAYETATIWSTSLSESELEKELSKIQEIIRAEDGSPGSTDTWGRRQLAYPIRKQTEGVYVFLRWEGDEKVTAGIDKHLRINDVCLRYLTLRADGTDDVPAPVIEKTPPAAPAAATPPAVVPGEAEASTGVPEEETPSAEAEVPEAAAEPEAVEEAPADDTAAVAEPEAPEEESPAPDGEEEKPAESGE